MKFAFEKKKTGSHSIWTRKNVFELEINVHINIQNIRLRPATFQEERATNNAKLGLRSLHKRTCRVNSVLGWKCPLPWYEAWTRESERSFSVASHRWLTYRTRTMAVEARGSLTSKKLKICFVTGLLTKGNQPVLCLFAYVVALEMPACENV